MTTIEFAIGETPASITVTPEDGDPNAVFRTAPDRIAAAVADHGYRFTDAGLTYQELTRAYRASTQPDTITLGDLAGRLVPRDGEADSDSDPDPDSASDSEGLTLTVIGPDDERLEQAFGRQQNLGAVAAAVTEAYNLGLDETVVLSPTADRAEPLPTETVVGDLTDQTVYWASAPVEA